MALLNFPSSPTNGQVYTSANGVSYQYNGTFWSAINTSYATGGFTKLDNISSGFNGSNTTFNLTASGVPVTPGTAQNLIITIGGVTQEPANAYTVSTSTITFTSAPPTGVTFSGVMLGAVMNVGVPSDSTVTSAKLDSNIAVSANLSYGGTLTGSTGVLNIGSGQIYKDTSGNIGIGTSSPNANAKLSLTDATAAAVYFNSTGTGGDTAYFALQKSADGLTFGCENRGFVWKTGSATVLGGTERMRLDNSGNLGLGVSPSGWGSGFPTIDIGTVSGLTCQQSLTTVLSQNAYYNGGWKYKVSNGSGVSRYDQYNGAHYWHAASSGTAGNTIPFVQAMSLDVGSSFVNTTTLTLDNATNATRLWFKYNGTDRAYIASDSNANLYFGSNGSERARIDSSGRLTFSNQPAFDAIPPANYTLNGGDQVIAGTWTEVTDRNNNFNPANGTFTAPVAGFYHFTWSPFVTSTSTRNDAFINVNGASRVRSEISGYAAGTTNRSSMVSVTTYLAANDNVTVSVYITGTGSTYVSQSPWGRFSGFLVG